MSKKDLKGAEDRRNLKNKIAELFREIGDEKRAKRVEDGRDVREQSRNCFALSRLRKT